MNQGETIVKSARGTYAVDPKRDPKIFRDLKLPVYPQRESGLKTISAFLTARSTMVDGGAHIGTYSVPLSEMCKEVIAFEPSPETFVFLAKNVSLNGRSNIDARNKGLGASIGKASLAPLSDGLATSQTIDTEHGGSIDVTTLDSEVSRADLVKLDIEGMEAEALDGAARLIKESRPVFVIEIFPSAMKKHGRSPAEIQRFLRKRGYGIFLPMESDGPLMLGKIPALWILTILIMPGWFLKGGQSLSYDIVAVPKEKPMPQEIYVRSAVSLIIHLILRNLGDKTARLKKWLGMTLR
ncbi:MAG: FkbM family methyltransferase [Patescibacteria group bacterium]|nr:FkbM family methyltransferase [Patescibacteria group bacterium]MDE1941171.1 FkbM family methyltransferase [Patescibacteria group bacterium]MDE1966812.1 FkbM family methyltransferase [Patescibacteria group bacterium]